MKMEKFSKILTIFGGIVLLLGVVMAFANRNAPVYLLKEPVQAENQTRRVMETLAQGDLETLGTLLYGQPRLEGEPEFDDLVTATLWKAYWESISYDFRGDCYACDTGLCRDVTVTALDICTLLPQVETRYQTLLPQKAARAAKGEAFLADGSYREEFAMNVLNDAAQEVLAEQQPAKSWNITLNLICHNGRWWVQADAALMEVLSGGMSGKEA